MLNLRHVSRHFQRSWRQINRGNCFNWAWMAYQELKPNLPNVPIRLLTYDGPTTHAFLYVDGLYYCAEKPLGVAHWLDLPFFRRVKADTAHLETQTPEEFNERWEVMDL